MKALFIFCLLLSVSNVFAVNDCWTDVQFKSVYSHLTPVPKAKIDKRLEVISRQFLGVPYRVYILGEGKKGRLDQCPLYRLDAFDCETFVTTILALINSNTIQEYKTHFNHLRYQDGIVSFITRNHFTAIDWNAQAQKMGLLKDITRHIVSASHHPIYKLSKTQIDKAGWYAHLSPLRVRLIHQTPENIKERLVEVKEATKHFYPVMSVIPYLPLDKLFTPTGEAEKAIFSQIPNGAIIEIVRPNWQLKDKIGTNLDVSHLGFAFWHNGILWFRNASLLQLKVVDVPLIDYLKEARKVATIGGINVQVVMDNKV